MNRHRFLLAVVALCGMTLMHMAARAAEDVLAVVPDDALAVVVVNRVGETQQKIETLGQQLQVPVVELLRRAQLSVQTQPHVDPKGAVAIAVIPNPDGQRPIMVWFVPTSDYQAFVKQFQPENAAEKMTAITIGANKLLVAPKGSYAALTEPLNRKILEKVLSSTRDVAAATAALSDWRAENDLYAIAMPSGIKFAQQQLLAGLASGKAQLVQQGERGKVAVAGLEMYESLFQSLDKEATHCGLGVRLMKDGVHVVSRTLLAEGGVTLQAAKEIMPAKGDLLAGLPQGPFVMAGGGIFPEAWMKRLMTVSVRMMKMYPGGAELTDEQAGKLVELSAKLLKDLHSMAMVLGVGQAGEPLYGDTVFLMRVGNAQEYLDNYARGIGEMSELGKASKSSLFSYRVEETPIDGKPGLKVSMNMAAFLAAGQPPEAKKMMELMFGTQDELSIYLVAANPHLVVGAYISQERLVKALKVGESDRRPDVRRRERQEDHGHAAGWGAMGRAREPSRNAAVRGPNDAANGAQPADRDSGVPGDVAHRLRHEADTRRPGDGSSHPDRCAAGHGRSHQESSRRPAVGRPAVASRWVLAQRMDKNDA